MIKTDEMNVSHMGKGETLLIIDDERAIVDVTVILMEMAGYKVLTAFNGLEGLKVFAENLEQVDLIICDLNMPKLGGHSLIHKLRAIRPSVKILIISGSVEEESVPTYLEKGEIEFLHKPFTNETLLEILRTMLD